MTSVWSRTLPNGDTIEVWRGEPPNPLRVRWYWHVRSANGRIILTGGQGFTRKWSAKRAALRATRTVQP